MKLFTLLLSILFIACASPEIHTPCDCSPELNSMDDIIEENDSGLSTIGDAFSIRYWIILDSNSVDVPAITFDSLYSAVLDVNIAFEESSFQFIMESFQFLQSDLKYQDLTASAYNEYFETLVPNNSSELIDVYLIEQDESKLCEESYCAKSYGFSGVASSITSLVISLDRINDKTTFIHELGHFFGLEHTFQDTIADTPFDPGPMYGALVNYHSCKMDHVEYDPMINNYMSYYNPCYCIPSEFTPGQIKVINEVSNSPVRISMK